MTIYLQSSDGNGSQPIHKAITQETALVSANACPEEILELAIRNVRLIYKTLIQQLMGWLDAKADLVEKSDCWAVFVNMFVHNFVQVGVNFVT